MELWQIIGIICIGLIILEIFTPTLFFLNLAIGAFITGIVSLWYKDVSGLIVIFAVLSAIILIFIRPLLYKKTPDENKTGIEGKYIGKTARVDEEISRESGVISIYGERWEARVENDETIPAGTEVKIIRNDSLIMYVEK